MPLSRSFTTTRYVDLDAGSDAADGLTNSTPWRTLAKVTTALFPGSSGTGDPISVLVILAGTSGGTNATSTGTDQFTYDASARTLLGTETAIGIRMWTEADGARPSSGRIARPLLRADTPFTSLTQIGATSVWKSNNIPPGGTVIIGQVLYKPGQLAQMDADGAWKSHIEIDTTRSTDAVDANVAALPYLATANRAVLRTTGGQTQIFVNVAGGLSTSAANWSWCSDQVTENFSKIRPIGFTYVGVQDVDTLFGERGPVVFDSTMAEFVGVRAYEHGVHGIMCSYTNVALQNIRFEDCEVHGLGKSPTGSTMLAAQGSSGNFDSSNVRIINCKLRRYMLQNPSGARYTAADYVISPIGLGTATTATGEVTDAVITGTTIEDVSSAKTTASRSEPLVVLRAAVPADKTSHGNYPVRFENCYINTLGSWYILQDTNFGDFAVSFKNCRIMQSSTDKTTYLGGVRTANTIRTPTTGGTMNYMGVFGNTEWTIDIGTGDSTNTYSGFSPDFNGTGGKGLRSYLTARDSKFTMVTRANGASPLFEQNSTNDVLNKSLAYDVQRCELACVLAIGSPLNHASLVERDLPATGNTTRVFLNNTYTGYRYDAFSTANAAYSAFVTNVDPYAQIGGEAVWVKPDLAPSDSSSGSSRVGRSGR